MGDLQAQRPELNYKDNSFNLFLPLRVYFYECSNIMYTLGNTLIDKFGDSYGSIAARSWEDGIKLHNKYLNYLNDKDSNKNIMTKYAERIKKYNPSYTLPAFNTGG